MQKRKTNLYITGNKKVFALVTILLTILLVTASFLLGQTSPKSTDKTNKTKDVLEAITTLGKDFPSVNYYESIKKNEGNKYDKLGSLNPTVNEDVIEVAHLDWDEGLPALPIQESQLVVLGKVISSQAYLSNDNSTVYSGFKISIEKVFQNTDKTFDSKVVEAERYGGVVNFPSGYKSLSKINGQFMPKSGQRYVFFLTHNFPMIGNQSKDFYILTGYELKDGQVIPLDNPSGDEHPIESIYKDNSEVYLLQNLKSLINKSKNKSLQEKL